MRPDRVVIGTDSEHARAVLSALLSAALSAPRRRVVVTAIETAELIKYAANAFLATKITFINEMAGRRRCAEQTGRASRLHWGLDGRRSPDANSCIAGPGGLEARVYPKDARRK